MMMIVIWREETGVDEKVDTHRRICSHQAHKDSVTGTRASFRTYSTVRAKIVSTEFMLLEKYPD